MHDTSKATYFETSPYAFSQSPIQKSDSDFSVWHVTVAGNFKIAGYQGSALLMPASKTIPSKL